MPGKRPALAAPARAVLVTGGAKRIGRAIALAFATCGWDVAIHFGSSRKPAQATATEIRRLGRRAALLKADLADERAVTRLVAKSIESLGRLDCIVNNAACFEFDEAATCSYDSLAAHYRSNTAAPVILARELARHVADGEQGCVVNLLDQKLFNPNPDFFSYTLSKSALHAATTLLAQALAPKVRVVGIAPGITLPSGDQSDAGFEGAHARTPLRRSSTAEDVAQAVLFAAENRAITGSTILVDGGQHLVPTERDIMFLTEPQSAKTRSRSSKKAAEQ